MSTILIWRNALLPPSETFILAQANALQTYKFRLIGLHPAMPSLPVLEDSILLTRKFDLWGKLAVKQYRLAGIASRFYRQAAAEHPVLLHAHFGLDGTLAMPLAHKLQVPLMVTYHGHDATQSDDWLRRQSIGVRRYLAHREVLKREAKLFIAVSEFIKGKLLEKGFPLDKVRVHYIGVDTKLFCPNQSILRQPMVLFVGRLVEKKGCEYLIRAMAEVQKDTPDAELVIVGDGPLRSNLELQACQSLRKYRFAGWQTPSSVREYMNRAMVFSTPSIAARSGDAEGFGMVFAEAQSMGLPAASFASGGIPEAIAHGDTGLLAPEKDWRQLATNIAMLLRNRDAWTRMSLAGQERIRREFDLSKQSAKLEEIYRQVALNHLVQGTSK